MGVVIKELSKFKLNGGSEFRIEYTRKGGIHIHCDNVQVTASLAEYYKFANAIIKAQKALLKNKKDGLNK